MAKLDELLSRAVEATKRLTDRETALGKGSDAQEEGTTNVGRLGDQRTGGQRGG